LYEDRNEDTQWSFNTILNSIIQDHITINGAVKMKRIDLLQKN